MSTRLESPLNFNKLEAYSFRLQNLATAPSSPALGQLYLDTDDNLIYYWNGSSWAALQAGTSLTQEQVEDIVGAMFSGNTETGVTVTYQDGDSTIDVEVSDEYIQDLIGAMFSGNTETRITATYDDTNGKIDLVVDALSAEEVQDLVGAMVTGNTETGITVTYEDGDGTLDFVIGALNTLPAPAADLSLATFKITNLGTPTAATDAATKGYVDGLANGVDWKASVRVATTAAGTLASSFENGDTVDGVTLATGDRILIKDQAAGEENGIYTVNASGAPTRATDADASAEVTGGLAVWVNEGTANGDTGWVLTTNDAITLDTTALVFTQFTGLGQVTAGAALTKTGNTLDVAVDNSTIEVSSDALRVKDAGITDAKLASTFTKKYSATVGDGSTTAIAVTHNLGTRAVAVEVYDASTFETVIVDVVRTSTTVVTLTFATAPATNAYVVVVIG